MDTESTNSSGSSVEQKLRKTIEEKDYYQALNLYKSIFFRYSSKKRFVELRKLLAEGASLMLDHRQVNSGTELALLLIDSFKKSETPVTKDTVGAIIEITKHYTRGDSIPRRSFFRAAINWSSNSSNNNQGAPELHDFFSQVLSEEKDYPSAERHYLRGTNSEGYARMLVDWAAGGYEGEKDLFITRAVLQYLCLSNITGANLIFKYYTEKTSVKSPLINFVKFLLETVPRNSAGAQLFNMLREKYAPSIGRDETFAKFLDMIGKIHFGIEPKTSGGMGGLLSNFMKQMMELDE